MPDSKGSRRCRLWQSRWAENGDWRLRRRVLVARTIGLEYRFPEFIVSSVDIIGSRGGGSDDGNDHKGVDDDGSDGFVE